MISRTSQDIPAMLSLSCIRLAIVTASDERSGSCVWEGQARQAGFNNEACRWWFPRDLIIKKPCKCMALWFESVIYKMYSRQYLSTSGQKTYTGTKSKCNCLACMKPCGLFFAQRKSPPKWALQLSSFFIRCGAGCLPVSRRQSTDDSQCAKKHIRLAMPLRIGGFTTRID